MQSLKYLGLDVHRDTISVAVLDDAGKLLMQSILATHAAAILDFVGGLSGTVQVTFEEETHSAWLHDLLVRRVARVVVCDPRQTRCSRPATRATRSTRASWRNYCALDCFARSIMAILVRWR